MFKNLRTSTKLFLLCSMFVSSIVVATYGLVVEKKIAIEFVRKELIGAQYLEALRGVYAAILTEDSESSTVTGTRAPFNETLNMLAAADADASGSLHTVELEQSLAESIRKLEPGEANGQQHVLSVDALAKARNLASRIGDESNLALDPDLDSYYVQDIVVTKMPTLLGQIGELQSLLHTPLPTRSSTDGLAVRPLILDGMIRSTLEGIQRDSEAAYRGDAGDRLRQTIDADITTMVAAFDSYLNSVNATLNGPSDLASLDHSYATTVDNAITAWGVSQAELSRLLDTRLSNLLGNLRNSLILNGLLAGLSIALAVMTHRHIVRPLQQLEGLRRRSVRQRTITCALITRVETRLADSLSP